MKNKGLKRKSDPNKDENVTEYKRARKHHITKNQDYLSSLGFGNNSVVTPCTFSLLCIFDESFIYSIS